jgi:hypothetical protein
VIAESDLLSHSEDLPVPVPLQQYTLDSDEEPAKNREKTPSTSTDSDFTADLQFNKVHRIAQHELNDLFGDLDLPKRLNY